jgi:hypothetical protein
MGGLFPKRHRFCVEATLTILVEGECHLAGIDIISYSFFAPLRGLIVIDVFYHVSGVIFEALFPWHQFYRHPSFWRCLNGLAAAIVLVGIPLAILPV